jgi:NADPH:quinone reductase-like Zn-dependent oxidoreductase/acyl dehydratase
MKALLCQTFGLPDTLQLLDVPPPTAGPGQVVIGVRACSANFPDTLMIQDRYQFKPPLPFAPGGEVAGVVLSVGEGAALQPGDRVIALCGWGGFAEQVVVDARRCVPMPQGLDFVAGASLLYNYGTSYHALKDRAKLQPGETLLVLGAAGGVGLAAVELGKQMGARVIAAASSAQKLAACQAKGADELINYAEENLRERIKELTSGRGVDVVYDPVGDQYAEPALRSLAWGGRYLVVGFAGGEIPKIPLNLALLKGSAIVGVFWGSFTEKEAGKSRQNLAELAQWYQQGKISPHIYQTYPMAQAAQALWDLMERRVIGKAVVVMGPPEPAAPAPMYAEENMASPGHTQTETGVVFHTLAAVHQFRGQGLGTSDWLTVTQEMVNDFAKATLDFQWIHLDQERARRESPFGQTIAHGYLTLSLLPRLMGPLMRVEPAKLMVNYGSNRVRFITPVPVGSRLRLRAAVKEVKDVEGGLLIVTEATVEIEGAAKPACVAEVLSVAYL